MVIINTNLPIYKKEIVELYIESFSSGLSKQYIDHIELKEYINVIFEKGNVIIGIENNHIIAAMLTCPLKLDPLLPALISQNFTIEKCVYIAEMMVTELSRGKGIGKQLLTEFFNTVDKNCYSDAFIRVWDKNTTAINLYKKVGFEPVATIEHTKTKEDGKDTFVMKKIYLHQKLN